MSLFDSLSDDVDSDAIAMPYPLIRAIGIVPRIDSFFGCYLQSVEFVPEPSLDAIMATDCVSKILYNPDKMADPAHLYAHPPFLACAIVHELLHIFRMDFEFCKGRDMRLSNIALDAVINRDMVASGYKWPRADELGGFIAPYDAFVTRGFIASTIPGETAPVIYDNLKHKEKKDQRQPQAGLNGELIREIIEKAIEQAGGIDAVKRKLAQRVAGAQIKAEAIDAGKSPLQKRLDQAATQEAAEPQHGDAESLSEKVISWFGLRTRANTNPLSNVAGSRIRQGMMSSTKRRRRSMTVPSPMTDVLGYVVAGRKRHYDIRPAFAFDISGSIEVEDVYRAGGEANTWSRGMVGSLAQIPVCFFNRKVTHHGSLSTYRNATNIPHPGGGTDFNPVFRDWLAKLQRKPTHLVIWTDCMGDWPTPETIDPSIKLIIVISPDQQANLDSYSKRHYNYRGAVERLNPTFILSK